MPSPLSSADAQMASGPPPQPGQNNLMNQNIGPNAVFRPNQNPPVMAMQNQQQHMQIGAPMVPGRPVMNSGSPQFPNQQMPGPPGYHQTPVGVAMNNRPRWAMMPPQQRPNTVGSYPNGPQSSALIAQLTQPPNAMGGPNQFVNNNPQHPQILNPQQQAQLRMMNNQQNLPTSLPQQQMSQPSPQSQQQQNQLQTPPNSTANAVVGGGGPSGVAPGISGAGPGNNGGPQNPQPQSNQQVGANSQPMTPQSQPSQQQVGTVRERHTIWKGVLEWLEKVKPSDQEKIKRHVPCQVSANSKDGQPEL